MHTYIHTYIHVGQTRNLKNCGWKIWWKCTASKERIKGTDDIKMGLKETYLNGLDRVALIQGKPVVGSCENPNESPGSMKCGELSTKS